MTTAGWRPLAPPDLAAVERIGHAVHPAYPEDAGVAAERLRLFAPGCFLLADGALALGYALAHPWQLGHAPRLNTLLEALPDHPGSLHIHDVALLPAARGHGHGAAIIAQLAEAARQGGLATLALVAIAGTEPSWRRLGFTQLPADTASYGQDASYMTKPVT